MKIYVASSWRNAEQPFVVGFLRGMGHEVYDFRNPGPDNYGFQWTAVTDDPKPWTGEQLTAALNHPVSTGWAVGAGKRVVVYMPHAEEPELMYLMTAGIATTLVDVSARLAV